MSIVYRIDKEHGITYVVWDGVVSADDYVAQAQQLVNDPDWPPRAGLQLTDLQTFVSKDMLSEEVFEKAIGLVRQHKGISAAMRWAVVANSAFDKSRIFEMFMLREGATVIVFNTIATASTWLGIDIQNAERVLEELRAEARAKP